MVHSEDLDAHVKSIEEDTEYWRTKRLEPRVFRLIRKGRITFNDMIRASQEAGGRAGVERPGTITLEERVAALEIRLGEFIGGIQVATSIIGDLVLVEESRDEAGVYNGSLKFEHRRVSGTIEDRVSQLEALLEEEMELLHVLLAVLKAKGLITAEKLDEMLSASHPPRYQNGARIVAKAWLDPEFKSKLMGDAKGTLRDLGFALNRTPKLLVLEDTESVRNVVVCTLCSCYPYELLGNPPWWYKHDSYKEAVVGEPRKTLERMFKLVVPENVELRVYDSTSDIRYMVLPRRPGGTEEMSEDELASLVTEESLIGVGDTLKTAVTEAR